MSEETKEALEKGPVWLHDAHDQAIALWLSLRDNWPHVGFGRDGQPTINQARKFLDAVSTAMAALEVAQGELDKAALALAGAKEDKA